MVKKYKMSKSFKIFIIAVALGVIIFTGYQTYKWINREELSTIIVLDYGATNQDKTDIEKAVLDRGGKFEKDLSKMDFSKTSISNIVLEIKFPWYSGLLGLKSVKQIIGDLRDNLKINPRVLCIQEPPDKICWIEP